MIATLEASGLRALVHPLTDDDLADHTNLAHWIGEPVELDLDAPVDPARGTANQGMARFGKSDFSRISPCSPPVVPQHCGEARAYTTPKASIASATFLKPAMLAPFT